MMRLASLAAALVFAATLAIAQSTPEEPVTAGTGGVGVPKRAKTVQPVYPPEAQAQGIRGIVILELVIDKEGKVGDARVVRSVPGLDEAALAAVRLWAYEPTKVDGNPVSVRLTVPITFAMKLPEMTRQEGIPELRQGIVPPIPAGAKGPATVVAAVTLDPEGRVAEAQVVEGEVPWTNALTTALRTWRFAAPESSDSTVSFRVQADFVTGEGKDAPVVTLHLDGLRRSESLAGGGSPPPAAPVAAATTPAAPAASERQAPPSPASTLAPAAPSPAAPAVAKAAAPPVEVITAPPPPPAPLEPENGTSALRDVNLEPGVPDLAKGRRPVVPPFARMSGTSGTVQVQFSVSAAGTCAVQSANGPDLLKTAAEQTVTSWQFRRTQAPRLFLTAVFHFDGDKASAVVRPQAPAAAPAGS
jgi:TonB family protein